MGSGPRCQTLRVGLGNEASGCTASRYPHSVTSMDVTDDIRALVVPENGGPDVLEVRTLSRPQPEAGQVLVEVAASGVNFKDVYEREGQYPRPTPFVLGDEMAGRVVAV